MSREDYTFNAPSNNYPYGIESVAQHSGVHPLVIQKAMALAAQYDILFVRVIYDYSQIDMNSRAEFAAFQNWIGNINDLSSNTVIKKHWLATAHDRGNVVIDEMLETAQVKWWNTCITDPLVQAWLIELNIMKKGGNLLHIFAVNRRED